MVSLDEGYDMNRDNFSKILLILDISLCTLWLGAINYSYEFKVLLWLVPLICIWLSFLLYRKSRLAIYPIGMLAIFNVAVFMLSYSGMYDLYIAPAERLDRSLCLLVGSAPTNLLKSIGIFYIVIILPLILYVYYWAKKQLVPSSLGTLKSLKLCGYLMVAVALAELAVPDTLNAWISRMIIICAIVFVLVQFFHDKIDGVLTRYERLFVMILLVLAMGYFCGLAMLNITPLIMWGLLVAFYALLKLYCYQKVSYREFAFLTYGAWCFWFSLYTTDFLRIAMLVCSVVAMLKVSIQFMKETHRKALGIGLFLGLSFVIPVLCIGYNPCSALHAGRVRVCRDYDYSPSGLLYVESYDGTGIRDRYEMILPAEYDRIEILVPAKPFFKVKKDKLWYIYDIIAHELVSEEGYLDIIPYGKDAFLLKNVEGYKSVYKYMVLPYVDREKRDVLIKDVESLSDIELCQ